MRTVIRRLKEEGKESCHDLEAGEKALIAIENPQNTSREVGELTNSFSCGVFQELTKLSKKEREERSEKYANLNTIHS